MASVDLTNTWGAAFIGGMVTAVLYGITTLQTYLYFMNYPNDDVPTKLFVAAIWVLDTTHITLMCHALYYYLVSSYGVTTSLAYGVWSLFASVAVNILHREDILPMPPSSQVAGDRANQILWQQIVTVLTHLGFGIETVVFMFIKKQLSSLSQLTYYAVTPFGAALVVSDVFIAVALCLLLRENSSLTVFPRTKHLINILMIYAINRCLLTSAVAIAEVALWAVNPENSWFMAVDFTIGKLYANSLLASLNSRNFVRRNRNSGDPEFFLNTIHLADLPTSSGDMGTSPNGTDKLGTGDHNVLSIAGSARDIETALRV
ncbi:hypothetical protein F5141DRAFT_1237962 [Pisolithus sp. B1]|nr:hypothetical protein F5141DRAFT_1237962 [Pisolithus sp. B1]